MKITFLGTGTSQGVPVIACNCKVCKSTDPRNKRTRTSIKIEIKDKTFVIDTGPDFRYQMLKSNTQKLDAVLFTHEHKDHIAGLDDVRAFNYQTGLPMDIYATQRVQDAIKRDFYYVFSGEGYPGIPELKLHTISNQPFSIDGIHFTPIEVLHYKLPVLGFRFEDVTYITDAKKIPNNEIEKIKGSRILILNALRKEKHISHLTLSEALELAEEIKPEKTYLTHISHLMGMHNEVENELPENIFLSFDNLEIET
ncbi:MAG: MBL fold metallo-hydrolase [Bacteroidetes bacterium]|nr:MBL fold metallo-hydrolase [Bacteroidota bacterium]MBV6460044.1 Phosphoribosyl 1,2-cyclic phosphate phosphodiesterase [Flavobacteriales bacterium]WKZ76662.1 MAG: MBL fold metallo-hydrolase [Vicingaceae bacterium]MCL4816394.1 MBL fold metallo-hydrolase [Flavobacteriales bacterium]NOG95469.1 MBL fold metallo-hydrolase [Bacteroidota bacterium]